MNSLQEPDKLADDAVNEIGQLMEKWKNRLTPDNLRIAERYIEGDIEILLHLQIQKATYPTKFCAILNHCDSAGNRCRRAQGKASGLLGQWPVAENEHSRGISIANNKQEAVFVDVVKIVENPEVKAPTIVRLESIYNTYRIRADSLYFSAVSRHIFGRSVVNREFGFVVWPSSVLLNELPSQMVEATAQLVDRFTSNKREFDRWMLENPNFIDNVSGLRINVFSHSIGIGFAEGIHPAFEITDVLFGPFDFRPDAD
jgi:hypothetical protein